jgi:hypothetical protein
MFLPKFTQAVQPLLDDFARALGLHFEGAEGEEFLRSSLIQTAFYGLFAGWTLWKHEGGKGAFRWEDLGDYLRIPFLGGLFHEFRHPTRIRELNLAPHLERATATLSRVDADRFFARFLPPDVRADSAASWAIVYFYEPFLEAFDPELRKELGVWYTPWEIVRYQVKRIDRLLREELGCPRGFADDRVVVLDPCCGTGAYLIEVLRCIAAQLDEEGVGAMLGAKLLNAFCRRIIGFEILTAPFVVAQLQLWLILADLGVEPDESHRPAIYLTNALTGWDGPEQLKLRFPELQEEHDAAQRVKREERIIVILGNPPYNRFAGAPIDEESDLVDRYKGIRRDANGRQVGPSELYTRFGIRKQLLDDLYIRFLRLAELRIGERAEYGVVSWISNSSYLAGRSHPLMRESLLRNFHTIWIDNLHGNRLASERTPWGDSCETIFNVHGGGPGIKVGTCIATFLKRSGPSSPPESTTVLVRDFWGRAHLKRDALLTALFLEDLPDEKKKELALLPAGPRQYETALPTARGGWKFIAAATTGGYEDWPSLEELFPHYFMGVHTGKDAGVVAFERSELVERFGTYLDPSVSDEEIERMAPALMKPANEFDDPAAFRRAMMADTQSADPQARAKEYYFRPLDLRWIWYDTKRRAFPSSGSSWTGCLIQRYGEDFLAAIQRDNLYLTCVSQPRRVSESRPSLTTRLTDLHFSDRGITCFPLIDPRERHVGDGPLFAAVSDRIERGRRSNLDEAAWKRLAAILRLRGDLSGDDAAELTRRLFHCVMAIGHSPQFESDHKDALGQDWLHLPIPRSKDALERIALVGEKIGTLLDPLADATALLKSILGPQRKHLAQVTTRERDMVRDDEVTVSIVHYGSAKGGWRPRSLRGAEVLHPEWGESTGDLWLNGRVYLAHVPEAAWTYELGGYPVVKKWLGYRDEGRRPERGLSLVELDWLREIVQRITALLLLRPSLDGAYEEAIADPFGAEELGIRQAANAPRSGGGTDSSAI